MGSLLRKLQELGDTSTARDRRHGGLGVIGCFCENLKRGEDS